MNLLQTVNIRGINVSLEEASEFCWRSLAEELLSISRSLSHLITIWAQLFESRLVLTRWFKFYSLFLFLFFKRFFSDNFLCSFFSIQGLRLYFKRIKLNSGFFTLPYLYPDMTQRVSTWFGICFMSTVILKQLWSVSIGVVNQCSSHHTSTPLTKE